MRISDWSSDVCSSDLGAEPADIGPHQHGGVLALGGRDEIGVANAVIGLNRDVAALHRFTRHSARRQRGDQRTGPRERGEAATRDGHSRAVEVGFGVLGAHAGSPWGRSEKSRKTRSEEHTSELQSLMRSSYAVFCLKKKKKKKY